MKFEDFKQAMLVLKRYEEWDIAIADLGINIWEREEVADLLDNYVKLISNALGLAKNDLYGTDLDYFMYEMDWGRNCDDEDSPFNGDLRKLYDYICRNKNN